VQATKALLAETGYVSTSPRDILTRSGAGQGSLYHHFRGKSDLAGSALQEVSAEMRAAADDVLDAEPDPVRAVEGWLTAEREALKGCRLGRLVAEPILTETAIAEPIAAYFRHIQSRLSARLAEARDTGRLNADLDPVDLAAALVAVVQGGYVLARGTGDAGAMRRAQHAAVALLRTSGPARAGRPDPAAPTRPAGPTDTGEPS
jgi:AcrR family transcriptional regulator